MRFHFLHRGVLVDVRASSLTMARLEFQWRFGYWPDAPVAS